MERRLLWVAARLCALASAGPACAAGAPATDSYSVFNPTPTSEMRPFSSDRPNRGVSPYTLDAGHFQYETDLFGVLHSNSGGLSTRQFFTADPVLKLGLTNHMDVELALGGYQNVRTANRNAGTVARDDGFGDVTVRTKLNLIGDVAGDIVAAIDPFVKLPTASSGLGNGVLEYGLTAPLQVPLLFNVTALIVTEFDVLKNTANTGKHAGFTNLINLSRPVTPALTAAVEFWSQVQTSQIPTQYTFDVAVAYAVGSNLQLDAAMYVGLNRATPGIVGYIGLSQRF